MSESLIEVIHWAALLLSLYISYKLFRDLADISQFWLDVDRRVVMGTWYYRKPLALLAIAGFGVAFYTLQAYEAGQQQVFWIISGLSGFLLFSGYINPGIMMRTQQYKGRFVSIAKAKKRMRPETSMVVIEHNGVARAHTEHEMQRPHVAGTPDGLGGENVVMTYCSLSNLGMAYKPEIKGKAVDLKVSLQLKNNLLLWDTKTGEPIQQLWGTHECDGEKGEGMEEWPSWRMTLRGFEKAYPDGEVFVNPLPSPLKNPILFLWDKLWDALFTYTVTKNRRFDDPAFPTIKNHDPRLAQKAFAWGFNVGDDYVAYTEEFVREQGNLINVKVGGRDIVVAYDPAYESLGVFYNFSGKPVTTINFFGLSDQGQLDRVETLKAAIYWCVWAEFYPQTDLNRLTAEQLEQVA